jgi:hypothetical protein
MLCRQPHQAIARSLALLSIGSIFNKPSPNKQVLSLLRRSKRRYPKPFLGQKEYSERLHLFLL